MPSSIAASCASSAPPPLLSGEAEARLFETLLTRFRERGLVKVRGQQRTDSMHVLAAIRVLNRFELVTDTLRHAPDALALAAPDWFGAHADPEWAQRYGDRAFKDRLPTKTEHRIAWAKTVGADVSALLGAVFVIDAPAGSPSSRSAAAGLGAELSPDGLRYGTEPPLA